MKLIKILGRMRKIRIEFTTDTGEVIGKEFDNKQLMSIVGLRAGIHGMGSILSIVSDGQPEEWCKNNPKTETEFQKAVKLGQIKSESLKYVSASSLTAHHVKPKKKTEKENIIYIFKTWGWVDGKLKNFEFEYETDDDFRDDLEYCRTKLLKEK